MTVNRQFLVKAFVTVPKVVPRTWPTQIPVLFLFTSVHLHTPSVVGKREEVFYLGRRADGIIQSLEPILTLLKSRKLTPVPETNIPLWICSKRCQTIRSDRLTMKTSVNAKRENKHLTGNWVLLLCTFEWIIKTKLWVLVKKHTLRKSK